MTNYIEEMMRTAGCKQQYCGWLDMGDLDTRNEYVRCDSIEEWENEVEFSRTSYSCEDNQAWEIPELKYPDFTQAKQLEIIKLMGNFKECLIGYTIPYENKNWYVSIPDGNGKFCGQHQDFTQALAQLTTEFNECGRTGQAKS